MSDRSKLVVNAAARSIAGEYRGVNEDNVFFNGDYITEDMLNDSYSIKTKKPIDFNLFAVCDGMGRNGSGQEAALTAVKNLADAYSALRGDTKLSPDEATLDFINDTNEEIALRSQKTKRRAGTTFGALVIDGDTAHAYNVGDSRVYMLRNGELFQLTRDHLPQRGESPADPGFDNRVSQFLGIYEDEKMLEPFRSKGVRLHKDDKFLICSDGISDNVGRDELIDILSKNKDVYTLACEVCSAAEDNLSKDNMSAIVVSIQSHRFHLTMGAIMAIAAAALVIVSFVMGYAIGYLIGNSTYGDHTPTNSLIESGEDISSEEIPSEPEEVSSEETPSEDVLISSNNSSDVSSEQAVPEVKSIKLNKSDVTVTYYEKFQLVATVNPSAAEETIEWSSSNNDVAVVTQTGEVTAVGNSGDYAVITALGKTSGKKATCIVRVYIPETTATTTTTTTTTTSTTTTTPDENELQGDD